MNKSYYNCTNGTDDALRYGMINHNKKEKTLIIIDRNGTIIYDSRVGFLDLKALSLKDELESREIHKLIAYMKPLLINATDRVVVNADNYQFYFIKLLTLNNIKNRNDVLAKVKIVANWTKYAGCISGGLSALFMIYICIKPDTTARAAANVAAHASHMINRTRALLSYAYGGMSHHLHIKSMNTIEILQRLVIPAN